MLLDIYFGTVAFTFFAPFLFVKTVELRLKRKGYKFNKVKKSLLEKVSDIISTILNNPAFIVFAFIPVCNILVTLATLGTSGKLENYELSFLKAGIIYKTTEENANDDLGKNKVIDVPKVNHEKSYDEMTREELLAILRQERTDLTGQSTPQVEDSFTFQKK